MVFEPITSSVYDFLDELANQHVIELNTAVKPYARMLIAEKLQEAEEQQDELTPRQQKELAFYLKDFGKETHEGKDWDRRIDLTISTMTNSRSRSTRCLVGNSF